MSVQHFVFCNLTKFDELDSTAAILEMPKLPERKHIIGWIYNWINRQPMKTKFTLEEVT